MHPNLIFVMKKYLGILCILILTALLGSCSKPAKPAAAVDAQFVISPELLHIDTLAQQRPDSALMVLVARRNGGNSGKNTVISTEVERSGEISFDFNENYKSLLLSEALYKTDNPQLNRDGLQTAIKYFDSLYAIYPTNDDLAMLSARSHYMNGVGFYENDSVVEACGEYLKTLEIMENHFDLETRHGTSIQGYKAKFMGLTYTRLGEVFYNNGKAQASIEFYKNALIYFKKVHNYSLANTYRWIGGSFCLDNQNDSALFYYRKATLLAKKQNKISVYGSSLSESAPIYYEMGYKDTAFMVIKEALLLPKSEDARLAQYFTFGSLLANECQYDSAIFYLEKSITRNSYATQTASAEILMNCYQALGDTAMMLHYKTIYGDNFTKFRSNSVVENKLTKIYESYKQEKLQKEHLRIARQRNRRNITISVMIFVFIIITIVIIRIRKTYEKQKSNKNIKGKGKVSAGMKRETDTNTFMDEPICKIIWETVHTQQFKSKVGFDLYKDFALSREQLLALRDAADRHYDNFTQKICAWYPKLSYDDIDYCCLYLLGLKDADISALMQRAYPTVCERGRKLKGIFKSTAPLPVIVKNIIASKEPQKDN